MTSTFIANLFVTEKSSFYTIDDISGNQIDLKTPAKYLNFKSWVFQSVREFKVNGLQLPQN